MLTANMMLVALTLAGCTAVMSSPQGHAKKMEIPKDAKSLVVAGGCFWCIEAQFEMLRGVYEVEAGYAGGDRPHVTYEQVCSGTTGHAETAKIYYDPKVISAADLLHIFFTIHDPTTLNRQGPDSGTQYRSAIFYANNDERELAAKVKKEIADAKIWDDPIVTTIEPLHNYTKAEEYHQDYFDKFEKADAATQSRMNPGYCSVVVAPKVAKFREKYAKLLKK